MATPSTMPTGPSPAAKKKAHAALVAVVKFDTDLIHLQQGPWKDFQTKVKAYLAAFPDTPREQLYAVNRAFSALRVAVSDLAADQLGGGRAKFIPRDRLPR